MSATTVVAKIGKAGIEKAIMDAVRHGDGSRMAADFEKEHNCTMLEAHETAIRMGA